jgi:RNA polymerase sigma factor (sigma-70 family)
VFAAAFAARGRYQPNREPTRAWLIGIANNLLALARRRRWRAARARARLAVPAIAWVDEELERADEQLSATLNRGLVAALVTDISPHEREAVLARIVDEKAYADIAREQGCSESTARKRVSRGLRRLGLALDREKS